MSAFCDRCCLSTRLTLSIVKFSNSLPCIRLSVAKVIRRCAVCCDASTHCFRYPAAKCRRQKCCLMLFLDCWKRGCFIPFSTFLTHACGIHNGILFVCLLCFGEFSNFPRRIGLDALDNGSADQACSLPRFLPTWSFAATSFKVETLLYLKNKSLILKALMCAEDATITCTGKIKK